MDTITLPRRSRDGSFTPEQVADALETLGATDSDEAVVVSRGHDSENGARNRARLFANRLREENGTLYRAHAVPDPDSPDSDPLFIAAVSIRPNQEPRQRPERPEGAPTMRSLQEAAREQNIKGRSKMSYDELRTAVGA